MVPFAVTSHIWLILWINSLMFHVVSYFWCLQDDDEEEEDFNPDGEDDEDEDIDEEEEGAGEGRILGNFI